MNDQKPEEVKAEVVFQRVDPVQNKRPFPLMFSRTQQIQIQKLRVAQVERQGNLMTTTQDNGVDINDPTDRGNPQINR